MDTQSIKALEMFILVKPTNFLKLFFFFKDIIIHSRHFMLLASGR